MNLADIVNGPWAVTPQMLNEIRGIYATHLKGDKIDLEAVEARLGRPLNNEPKPYQVVDGVAVIEIHGVIGKRMNMFTRISGGVSTDRARLDLAEALDDPDVSAILLDIDSPGGSVEGTPDLYNEILAGRSVMPIVAFSDGTIASAAYWLAAATHKIFIANDATVVGSIGVVAAHQDISGAEAKTGVKTTEITAGRYKRVASSYKALDDEGRADIQARIDYIYGYFVDSVAAGRGVSVDTVLEKMADGRIFIGKQSVENGLVDGVAAKADLIARIKAGEFDDLVQPAAGVVAANQEVKIMDIASLKKEHPALVAEIEAEALAKALPEAETLAITGERTRVLDLHQAVFGEEAGTRLSSIVNSGVNADQVKALAGALPTPTIVAQESPSRAEILAALEAAGPEDVDGKTPVKSEEEDAAQAFETKIKEYRVEHDCSRGKAMSKMTREWPELHKAWLESKQ